MSDTTTALFVDDNLSIELDRNTAKFVISLTKYSSEAHDTDCRSPNYTLELSPKIFTYPVHAQYWLYR
ncbi:hypothetical protein CEXT_641741 [Caerostris extrusa]|uniref:Uncharacterized protein n=1 Tax=Caerostris extrusa TaxID=172846 RepID=A0AAV4UK32_CAEEX|nr:hypothetical protein CEXT_641741 [Caerostris extrusa]